MVAANHMDYNSTTIWESMAYDKYNATDRNFKSTSVFEG